MFLIMVSPGIRIEIRKQENWNGKAP